MAQSGNSLARMVNNDLRERRILPARFAARWSRDANQGSVHALVIEELIHRAGPGPGV